MRSGILAQVVLVSALLVCTTAQTTYDRGQLSFSDLPKFSIVSVDRNADNTLPAERRELLIFAVPRTQAPHPRPHLVSLENVVGPAAARTSSPYATPTPSYAAPTYPQWNYKPDRSPQYFVALEDVRQPPPVYTQTNRHFSLFDVNIPAPPAIIINSYPREAAIQDLIGAHPLRDNLMPAIDVRASQTNQNVNTKSEATHITVSTDRTVPTTAKTDVRPLRSAEDGQEVTFPEPGTVDTSGDDSVEILAPLDRLRRNIVSLENVVGPGQIGYPVYRLPQQPVASRPHFADDRHQYIGSRPYLQQYPTTLNQQPYVVGDLCPWGSCYRYG